jgi:hypothetical protein
VPGEHRHDAVRISISTDADIVVARQEAAATAEQSAAGE